MIETSLIMKMAYGSEEEVALKSGSGGERDGRLSQGANA
jgi:hypothetical protein